MATLTRGISYGSTEQITNSKLHQLIDNGTVTSIVDADISNSAAIAYSKLSIGAAAINYSKLNLTGSVVDADISSSAAIATSKIAFGTTNQGDLFVDKGSGITRLTPGTNGQYLQTQGAGANPQWATVSSPTYASVAGSFAAGSNPIAGPSILTPVTATSYTKYQEMYVPRGGTLRIVFSIVSNDGGRTVYGKIYRNGSAVGTERTNIGSQTYDISEDISGWSAGDLLQIYGKVSPNNAGTHYTGFLKVYEGNSISPAINTGLGGNLTYVSPIAAASLGIDNLGSIGDFYINTGGGASTTLYVKTGASTWTAK